MKKYLSYYVGPDYLHSHCHIYIKTDNETIFHIHKIYRDIYRKIYKLNLRQNTTSKKICVLYNLFDKIKFIKYILWIQITITKP